MAKHTGPDRPLTGERSGIVEAVSAYHGKYVFERRLGGGGMAEVFLGRVIGAEGFSRRVAIKRVLPGHSQNPSFARMFIAEAQLTSRLQHPNCVSILDFDRDLEGNLFLVLELVEGTDLDGLLATGRIPISLVLHVAIEILRGLEHAHELPASADGIRGIVHRDISPHNVLLSWEGAVKVSDFGIAKAHEASVASASLFIKGKPAYMSPEQVNGESLDGRSDLFAVGVVMFEMLCQRHLFAGNTTHETFARLLTNPIPDVRDVRTDVPDDLARVVATLLRRDRNERYRNAGAAIAELQACRDLPRNGREELVALLKQRLPQRAVEPAGSAHLLPTIVPPRTPAGTRTKTAQPTATLPPHLADPTPRRRRLWPVIASAVAIGAIAGLIATNTGSGNREASKPEAAPAAKDGSAVVPSSVAAPAPPATPPVNSASEPGSDPSAASKPMPHSPAAVPSHAGGAPTPSSAAGSESGPLPTVHQATRQPSLATEKPVTTERPVRRPSTKPPANTSPPRTDRIREIKLESGTP